MTVAALLGLARDGKIDISYAQAAAQKYNIDDPTKA